MTQMYLSFSYGRWRSQNLLVFYKFQALFAIKGEFGVRTYQSHFVGDGLSNNDMVKGIFVVLFFVDM